MAANGHGRCPEYLAEGVQYLLYDQLSLTVEASCRVTVASMGNLAGAYCGNCTVLISHEILWSKLVLISTITTVL